VSETRIVNRFPVTAGLEQDLDEAEQAEQLADDIFNQAVAPVTITGTQGTFNTKTIPSEDIVNSVFDSDTNPFLAADSPKTLNEIAALRAQVIKAFKHMGIDTRKFFGV
jgi:hypothetical protein